MKIPILLLLASIVSLLGNASAWTDEDRRTEAEQVALWTNKLGQVASDAPNVKFSELWLGLRNMGHRVSSEGHSPEVDKIYEKLQFEFLSIPGHARYYRDEIERERKTVEHLERNQGKRSSYNRNRKSHFETLAHLPSPETIGVLGDFLADERDKSQLGVENLDHIPGNSAWSVMALSAIGLRQPPVDGFHYFEEGDVERWRGWWEEIKSGKRNFSFKGQAMEYRFKPDGTWETIAMVNPPDDSPTSGSAEAPGPIKRPLPPTSPTPDQPPPPASPMLSQWWIIGGGILALVAAAFLFKRRHAL